MTKAEFRRKLTSGMKLRCVHNWRGPCDFPRTVLGVRAQEIAFSDDRGRECILGIGRGVVVNQTLDGFIVIDPEFEGHMVYKRVK